MFLVSFDLLHWVFYTQIRKTKAMYNLPTCTSVHNPHNSTIRYQPNINIDNRAVRKYFCKLSRDFRYIRSA